MESFDSFQLPSIQTPRCRRQPLDTAKVATPRARHDATLRLFAQFIANLAAAFEIRELEK